MKRKLKILFIALSVFVFQKSGAQTTLVKGVVSDSVNVLEQAQVVAFDTVPHSIETYSVSNSKGRYQLLLQQNKYYELRISYLGYKTAIIPIKTALSDTIVKNVRLRPNINELNAVDISYTVPVKIEGDTVTYDAKSFSNGNEKKLEDILQKLPGIEVEKNGDVKVNGKKVSKIMLDNKDFFSGDTKLASQNIPADVIDKVQVLNNYNEIDMMRNVDINENPVINIKLKQGKKRFWFGDINAGAGYENRYIFNPKIFYYSPKTSINFIGTINNTGKQAFTFQDYIRFSGGIGALLDENSGTISFNSDELSFLFLPNNTANRINTKFSALNINHNFSKKLTAKGFVLFSADDIKMLQKSNKDYFYTIEDENTISRSDIKNQFVLYKLGLTYQPGRDLFLNYSLFGKYNDGNFANSLKSNIYEDIYNEKNHWTNELKQQLRLYYSIGKNSIVSLNAQHKHSDNKLNTNLNTFQHNYPFLPFYATDSLNFTQFKNNDNNDLQAKFEYIYVFNRQNNIKLSLGQQYSENIFALNTKQFLQTDEIDFPENTVLGNYLKTKIQYYYTKINYKTIIGKLTASSGIKLHYIDEANIQEKQHKSYNTKFSADVYFLYQFMKTRNISFRYYLAPQFIEYKKLSEAYLFDSYNTLSFGNRLLNSSFKQIFSLDYMDFNNFSFSNTQIHINYSRMQNPVNTANQYIDDSFISEYIHTKKPDESLVSNISYEKRIKKFKVKLNNELYYSFYENKISNQLIDNKIFSHNYKISTASYFKNAPNLELAYKIGFDNYYQNKQKSEYINSEIFADIEIPFLKQFIFTSDFIYNRQKNTLTKNKEIWHFFNAGIYYKTKNSTWEFSVLATNILNTKSLRKISETELFIYNSDYYVLPRQVLFQLNYKL